MTASRSDNEVIFHAARDVPDPDRRREYVRQACGGDEARIALIEALLAVADAPDSLLDHPAIGPDADATQAGPSALDADAPLDFLAPSDKPDVLGRLGHYEILEVIGRGGMGIVLRAFDEKLHRIVAVKVMSAQLATNVAARRRFTREAQAQAAVSHDHVVTIHAVEGDSPQPYLVMHYVAGLSLQQRLDRDGPLALHEILRIGMQTAAALSAAHAQGLIHRDIKPANILLENGVERVKVTDFGLARVADEASMTQSGVVAGTPHYMSPEQAEGKPLDQRTDLFSLGSVLYAMCTGRAPFRASGTMAVLKRVCEETPTPIRETNPEIPDWLVAIIDKLHAKDPAERFQTAAEVADLLSRHLAHVQHPSVASLSVVGAASRAAPSPARLAGPTMIRQRRWAIAAAVVVCLGVGFGLSEATGTTRLTATVVRIFTPDGTLVVEVDDPGVKVTIEGDGGLVITGAGLEEIRLRPGNYKIQADRDGKRVPLEKELVSIAKGGREVVKVKLEAAPAQPAAKAEKGAFVLLAGGKGVAERKFDTLADAVQGASDGDTIEVRGDGPFVTNPITIDGRALVIRGGKGFRPLVKVDPNEPGKHLIRSNAPVILEGLDLQWVDAISNKPEPGLTSLVVGWGPKAQLHIANCRFLMNRRDGVHEWLTCVAAWDTAICRLRNCQFGRLGLSAGESQVFVDNCLFLGPAVQINPSHAKPRQATLRHNTMVRFLSVRISLTSKIDLALADKLAPPIEIEMSGNVLASPVIHFGQSPEFLNKGKALSANEADQFLKKAVSWRGQDNLFPISDESFVSSAAGKQTLQSVLPVKTLDDWKVFWEMAELDAQLGQAKFQAGDLASKAASTPELLPPEDFRLRPDSAGKGAGPDGKDLGADVDLVGPGAAYERWKKMPEYEEWLKETGQLSERSAAKSQTGAFVVQSGKGVEVRKFDTLAEAVQGASDGDTIEIGGNGPFVSQPINIQRTALTIRAGEGFRPVIQLSPEGVQGKKCLLNANAALVLEGLELHHRAPSDDGNYVVHAHGPLRAANCRFRDAFWTESPVCAFRNCEFRHVGGPYRTGTRWTFENCLFRTQGIAILPHYGDASLHDVGIQIRHSTFVSRLASLNPCLERRLAVPSDPETAAQPIRLEVSGSIFSAQNVLGFDQSQESLGDSGTPQPAEAEATLRRLLQWRGERNLFVVGSTSVAWGAHLNQQPPQQPLHGPKSLEEWKRFWNGAEVDSLEGRLRFQGGNLLARMDAGLDQLTPEDFRLRPDSAGYRAGPDGKDLGADVDLVGPGPAYERWKKTPEYQEWLKDSGQQE